MSIDRLILYKMFVHFQQQQSLVDQHVQISMDLHTDHVYDDEVVEVEEVDLMEALNKMQLFDRQHHFQPKVQLCQFI